MTNEAKWVINCVAETKGRYGQAIVLGTLLGANRARLKELGTVNYKSYGMLKGRSEAELRLLISQMLLDGYLYQTKEQYSVLRMGDISPLRDENTRVMIKIHEEKESSRRQKSNRRRSTDDLTGAGYELFEKLRNLRLEIAREEAMPPYIIFSDKTLIDMCAKAPKNQAEMLDVSGVGAAKYDKYGQRFLDEIKAYQESHPDSVISIREEEAPENTPFDRAAYNRKMNRPEGAGAAWTDAEDKQLDAEFELGMEISEIATIHDRTSGAIRARLKKHGLIE